MLNIFINGINGKMGRHVAELVMESQNFHLIGGSDHYPGKNLPYKVITNFKELFEIPDVIIDFTRPSAITELLTYATNKTVPLVIATTGFSKEEQEKIVRASSVIPIFQSSNMSYAVNLVAQTASELATKLDDYDIEILETHHNQKVDSPSGTALMLADKINGACNQKYIYNFDRYNKKEKRNKNEIGFSSIRGGNIVGEHSVLFFSDDEVIEIKHTALSRKVFAKGSLKAAGFIVGQTPGLYESIL